MNDNIKIVNFKINKILKRNIFVTILFVLTIVITFTSYSLKNCLNYLSNEMNSLKNYSQIDVLNLLSTDNLEEFKQCETECEINKPDVEPLAKKVEEKTEILVEDIPFSCVTKYDDTMNLGEKRIVDGTFGIKKIMYKNSIFDDVVVESEKISEEVVQMPVDQVEYIGTKPKLVPNVCKNDEKAVIKKKIKNEGKKSKLSLGINEFVGDATAYTSSMNALTSTGKNVYEGIVAVNSSMIPYHSKLEISALDGSFKFIGQAEDTGPALKNHKALVDIWMPDKKKCLNFGRKKVKVRII